MSEPRLRILIIRLSSLGDVVLSQAILKALPTDACIDWLVGEPSKIAILPTSDLGKVIEFRKFETSDVRTSLRALARDLRSRRYDWVLDIHSVRKTWILRFFYFWVGGPSYRWKTLGKPRVKRFAFAFLKRHCPPSWRPGRFAHEVQRFAMEAMGKVHPEVRIERKVSPCSAPVLLKAPNADALRSWFGVAPGSAWEAKRWSTASFAESCLWIVKTFGLKPAVIGVTNDPQVQALRNELDRIGVGYETILDYRSAAGLCEKISACRFVLSNDSFAAHLAEAVGVPIVALYSATHPDYGFGPLMVQSRAVHADLWCSPCSKDGGLCFRIGTDRFRCREEISQENVRGAIAEVMGSTELGDAELSNPIERPR